MSKRQRMMDTGAGGNHYLTSLTSSGGYGNQQNDMIFNGMFQSNYLAGVSRLQRNRDRQQILDKIIVMMGQNPVHAAREYRNSLIDFNSMILNDGQGMRNTPEMQLVIEKYWHFLARRIDYFFTAIALCPYKTEKRRIPGSRAVARVPVAYEPQQLGIQDVWYDDGTVEFFFYDKYDNNKEIEHVVTSKLHNGPSHFSPMIDSEAGAILPSWDEYQEDKMLSRVVKYSEADPILFIQRNMPSAMHPTLVAHEEFQKVIEATRDQYGNIDKEAQKKIQLRYGRGVVALPDEYIASSTQNRPSMQTDEQLAWRKLVSSAGSSFRLPVQKIDQLHRQGQLFGSSKSEAESDEDRQMISVSCTRQADAIATAIREVWYTLYEEVDIPVHLPFRDMDRETLITMRQHNILSEEQFAIMFLRMVGMLPQNPRVGTRRNDDENMLREILAYVRTQQNQRSSATSSTTTSRNNGVADTISVPPRQ
jgi:hypothetical protein